MEKVIIVWSGPAGHTSAIYLAKAMLKPLMFEWFMAGWVAAGGQLTTTTLVENFPGFPNGILGSGLMDEMRAQSINSGVRIETLTVDRVNLSQRPFKVFVWDKTYETESLIVATWATAKRMWLPGEDIYRQRGVSACAVCDGGLPMFRDKPLAVVWWGDSAMEEAIYLSKFWNIVYILVRKDTLKASKVMQEKAKANDKIKFLRNTEAREFLWDGVLTQVKIFNNKNNEESLLEVSWLFYAIGHKPNTVFLEWQIDIDEAGYILTKPGTTQTSVEWVFAAWDVQDKIYRQAITSAGTGCMAALEAEKFLD